MTPKIETSLGIDAGSSSLGSAWVDFKEKAVYPKVTIFTAGVHPAKHPKEGFSTNHARREFRSKRRQIRRKKERRLKLRKLLTQHKLLPKTEAGLKKIFGPNKGINSEHWNPWTLRKKGIERKLTKYEFGRVLIHLNQRRGSSAISERRLDEVQNLLEQSEGEQSDEKKKAINAARRTRQELGKQKFGQYMASLYEAKVPNSGKQKPAFAKPIRNLRGELTKKNNKAIMATRKMISDEFEAIWEKQCTFSGALANLLKSKDGKNLRHSLYDADLRQTGNRKRQDILSTRGVIFEQRKTYWNVGTLARCTREPADRRAHTLDEYAEDLRILGLLNNVRIPDESTPGLSRCLSVNERDKLIKIFENPKTEPNLSAPKLKEEIAAVSKTQPDLITLGETDTISTKWFKQHVINNEAFSSDWKNLKSKTQKKINNLFITCDPENEADITKVSHKCGQWFKSKKAIKAILDALQSRPAPKYTKLSRRAIRNVLPYLENYYTDQTESDLYYNKTKRGQTFDPKKHRWITVPEAFQRFAEDPNAEDKAANTFLRQMGTKSPVNSHQAGYEKRLRYAEWITDDLKELVRKEIRKNGFKKDEVEEEYKRVLKMRGLNKKSRQFQRKHPKVELPPAPMTANPVVRRTIHIARRHILEHIKERGGIPDQIVIELARDLRRTKKQREKAHERNIERKKARAFWANKKEYRHITKGNPHHKAVDRLLLWEQQKGQCPYSPNDNAIEEEDAASGNGLDLDHIVPRCQGGGHELHNKVLCFAEENRKKGNRTPKKWLSYARFASMESRVAHLNQDSPANKTRYFSKKDNQRKYKILHAEKEDSDFRQSYLAATAYAAKQLGSYLKSALYPDKPWCVVFTNGRITSMLRKDWRLMRSLPKYVEPQKRTAKKIKKFHEGLAKDRNDHRHHAIDAVIIACAVKATGKEDCLAQLQYHLKRANRSGYKRPRLHPPWPSVRKKADAWQAHKKFRSDVLKTLFSTFDDMDNKYCSAGSNRKNTLPGKELIVEHQKQIRISGALFDANLYGSSAEHPGMFVIRKELRTTLTPNSFLVPLEENGVWKIPGQGPASVIAESHMRKRLLKCLSSSNVPLPSDWTWKSVELCFKYNLLSDKAKKTTLDKFRNLPNDNDRQEALSAWIKRKQLTFSIDLGSDCSTNPAAWHKKHQATFGENKHEEFKKIFQKIVDLMHDSDVFTTAAGVPIIKVKMLAAKTKMIQIKQNSNSKNGGFVLPNNNHHYALFKDGSGNWFGEVRSMYEVAEIRNKRLTEIRDELRKAGIPPEAYRRKKMTLFKQHREKINQIVGKINNKHPLFSESPSDGTTNNPVRCVGHIVKGQLLNLKKDPKDSEFDTYVVVTILDTNDGIPKIGLRKHWESGGTPSRRSAHTLQRELHETGVALRKA